MFGLGSPGFIGVYQTIVQNRTLSAGRKRPQISIPRESSYFHLAISPRATPLGDTPRGGILWKYGRDRIRPPQNVARVVTNATCRFCRETLAPDGGIERVAQLTLKR